MTPMAHRSDRRGVEPITSLCSQEPRSIDWLPTREFLSWPGPFTPTKGPEIRLQSTLATTCLLTQFLGESRYAC